MSLEPFQLTAQELVEVQRGLADYVEHRPSAVPLEVYGPKIREFGMGRAQAAAKANAEKSTAFLKTLGETAGATTSPTGVVYVELQAGTGANPTASDVVTVHYRGTLADGTGFDSSYGRGEPAQFPLGQVIPCWTEGIQKMKVGAKAKLGCPANLAYGDQGQGDIPPGAALLFEVELLGIGA
jgi:FKBP-type peptidyl-prolyl cis-trans isomerase FkpA